MQKKKVNMIILVVSVLLTLIGLSYGYFFIKKNQDNNNVADSKCFKLEFSNESEAINLSNMYPISDEEGKKQVPYSFTITNTCDMLAGYTVNMEMLEGTTLNSKYLDVLVNNEEIKLLSTYEATDTVIANSTESRILTKGTLAYNDSVDYTVRFWMDKDVEDIESMNKYFASKIVVTAQPSNYNPKEAGYDTLHDAILANEYQTTPDKAIEKIKAKGKPDLSQTAPIIKWLEKTDVTTTINITKPAESVIETYNKDTGTGDRTTQASNLTLNDTKIKFYKTKIFDSETGQYSLTNFDYFDPTMIDYSGDTKYYIISEKISYDNTSGKLYTSNSNNNVIAYLVTGATKINETTIWNGVSYDSVTYKLNLLTLTETELETDKSDKGLYQALDDYGTTYYYRGNVKNNNVYFAGYYWQIVRINGDGSIRLIYNGTQKDSEGNDQSINNKLYQFNNVYNDPTYVGYMYGNSDSTIFDEVHNNTNSSKIKITIENWYKTNIEDKGYSQYINATVGFCGDRTISSGNGISNTVTTNFGAYERLQQDTAQFTCPNVERDLYTDHSSSIGNKALTYPVGLITSDELIFAGMRNEYTNKLSWIYSSVNFWTMSPSIFNTSYAMSRIFYQISTGRVHIHGWPTSLLSVRPVINLKKDVKISGGIGTSNNPYVVDTNN